MSVTVTGNNISDIHSQIGWRGHSSDVHITFRSNDFGRVPYPGCIIDDLVIYLSFKDSTLELGSLG